MRDDFERIRADVKAFAKQERLKVSVTTEFYSGGRSITVAVVSAPKQLLVDSDYCQVNQYYIKESEYLTAYGKRIMSKINDIIKKEHWDESDVMADYFHCAFYYNLQVGKWNKPFRLAT